MKQILTNTIVVLISTLIVYGSCEVGARLFGLRPEPPVAPLFSWARRGEYWTLKRDGQWMTRVGRHPVSTNSLGFRDREWGPKAPGDYRILVLGDSVTFGHGQAEEATFVRQLEQIWAEQGLPIEVLNAGIPGWSTYQQRRFFEDVGWTLEPDLVLVGFVLNDITEIQSGLNELALRRGSSLMRGVTWLSQRSAAFAALKRGYVDLFRPENRVVWNVQQLVDRADAPEVRHAVEQTLSELARLEQLASERGAGFAVAIFPFSFQFEGEEQDLPQRELLGFARERGIPALDLLPVLRVHPPAAVLMDADHFTPKGHRLVAEALAHWLEAEQRIPASNEAGGS